MIANEVIRLSKLPSHEQKRELGDRIARAFTLSFGSENSLDFQRELDFNAHLVTHLRERGIIWARPPQK